MALDILEKLREGHYAGVFADTISFNAAIAACRESRRLSTALYLIEEMKRLSLRNLDFALNSKIIDNNKNNSLRHMQLSYLNLNSKEKNVVVKQRQD